MQDSQPTRVDTTRCVEDHTPYPFFRLTDEQIRQRVAQEFAIRTGMSMSAASNFFKRPVTEAAES